MANWQFIFPIVLLLGVAACIRQEVPVPVDKPTPPPRPPIHASVAPAKSVPGRADFLRSINTARVGLALHEREEAGQALEKMARFAPYANRARPMDSELSATLGFSRLGAQTSLLVGLEKGKDRYDDLFGTLKIMHLKGIEPTEISLAHTAGKATRQEILEAVAEARRILRETGKVDPERAFIEADRPLEKIYLAMQAQEYTGTPKLRLQLYMWLSRELLHRQYYTLATASLQHTKEACEDYRLHQEAPNMAEIKEYREEIESLEKAHASKNPSLMRKLSLAVREALYDIQN